MNSSILYSCLWGFQKLVLETQRQLEDGLERYAKTTGADSVLICDRGLMDGAGYMDRSEFELLLKESNLDFVTARDTRYNAVLHLVTAADGAEPFYTLANNQTRTETVEEARHQDLRVGGTILTKRYWR